MLTEISSHTDKVSLESDGNAFQYTDDVISFASESNKRPLNWSTSRKLYTTVIYGLATFSCQFNSATMASEACVERLKEMYGVSRGVATLGTSLYVLGIGVGPMIFAPISEMYGRKTGVMVPYLISSLFTFATSISFDVPGIMVTRFLAGFFSGAPIVSTGGVLADIWSPTIRGTAMAFYAIIVGAGPSFGPIITSLLIQSSGGPESWRIPQWVVGLFQLAVFVIGVCTVDETYEPVIVSRRAKEIRLNDGKWAVHSKHEEWHLDWKETVSIHFMRPFAMLATPIVFLMVLFASYVYGLFYLIITNVSLAFNITRGWEGTVAELPLIAFFTGSSLGCVGNMLWSRRYKEAIARNDGIPIPEQRLPFMMMTSWFMPLGIFIFGWTSKHTYHWMVPCIGIFFIAFGFITIFQTVLNYLVDSFPRYSASAIAANTFLRSVFGAAFPLFAKQLFTNVGVAWGSSIIGFIALGMIPIPFVFFMLGARIRAKNPYANRVS